MQQPLIDVHHPLSRREFLRRAGLAGAGAVLLGACGSDEEAAAPTATIPAEEPPPETNAIRLAKIGSICISPQYLAADFLPAEGFTDVQYSTPDGALGILKGLAAGDIDISLSFAAQAAVGIDSGDPLVILAGAHVGCFELFGSDQVQSVRDFTGKTIAVDDVSAGAAQYVFVASILAFVGVDPVRDVNFVKHTAPEAIQLLADKKVDGYLAFPPVSNELRVKKIGHVVVNSMRDQPWSQYVCCLVTANRTFFEKNPVATKRALRAILRGADVCFREPERAARFLVDKGYTDNYEYALDTMKLIPYNVWREFDPEDTLRFYSLRLNEAGIIKSTPDEIIARGTDWRFLDELKRELAV